MGDFRKVDLSMDKTFSIIVVSLIFIVLSMADGAVVTAQSSGQNALEQNTQEQIAVVGAQGAVLQAENGTTMRNLAAGELIIVQGRSADGRWLKVQTEERQDGWIDVNALLIIHVSTLPIFERSSDGTQTSQQTTDRTVLVATATPPSPTLPATETASAQRMDPLPAIVALVTLADSRLNVRIGPSTAYPVVAKADPGSRWAVSGQTKAGDWLQLRSMSDDVTGWAMMQYLKVEGSGALPVVTAFPTPPTAEQTLLEPVSTASRILLPTPAADTTTATTELVASIASPGKSGLSGILAFQDRIGGTIYLYDLNRDILTPLTAGIDPAISPDGQRVAFTRDGGAGGLYVINRDGSSETRIYNDHPLLRAPSWSPDGRWIVFSRANGAENCRVLRGSVCLPDETIIEALPEPLQNDAEVKNLVKGIPNQRTYHTSLARIAADGTEYRDIPALDYAAAPDWNEGGIVYQSNAGIQLTADADVRSAEVANDPLTGYFHDPDWQPGGGRIVFHRKRGSHWQIYGVNPDGTGLVALTQPVTALVDELPSSVSPVWSPDGQQILYLSNRNSLESAGAWHFWVMNADGSEQRMLPIDVVLDYTFSSEQMVSWAAQ